MSAKPDTEWQKSRRSAQGTSCVEQRRYAGMIEVRDTKDHGTGPVLRFTAEEYAAWVDGVRKGEFDHLT